MPAQKAARAHQRRWLINRRVRSSTRTAVKKAVRLLSAKSEESASAVKAAISKLDRAAAKGVVHRNAVARGKSRLMKRLNRSAE